jgi:aspartyl-tRNA(Asn)/glutamyl-tRNA(Gln) amidotransferase subunit A
MSYIPSTIREINKLIDAGKLSYTELINYYLENIQSKENDLAAFLFINKKIIEKAEQLDRLKAQGKKLTSLAGMVFSLKDNILEKGRQTTAGSKILKDYIASYDATAVKKLKKQQALCIGKTNLDEFGMGSSTENSAFQITKNPLNRKKVPGGSSGGAAASVMADECLFALGTDTGGSIRQPAAFCGAVGLKPTYGRVSRHGLIALASSLDVIGSVTKTVEDAAEIFYAIAGQDNYDATNFRGKTKPKDLFKKDPKKLIIGIPEEYFPSELDSDINKIIHQSIDQIAKAGFKIQKIKLPHTLYGLAAYYIIMPSEASANLARYDTLRYNSKTKEKNFKDIIDFYIKTRTKKFGDEVRRRIILGVYSLSAGYYDDYYIKAQQTRRILQNEFAKAFKQVDILITPTTPTVAFDIGAKKSPLEMYFSDIFTVPASLAGLPALSLPCGKKDNLPIGMQLIGKKCHEDDLFEVANYLEKQIFSPKS